jgi:HSP20 family protein
MATETRSKQEMTESADERMVQRPGQNRNDMRRWESDRWYGPHGLMRQMQDEMDRWFGRLGWSPPSSWLARTGEQLGDWSPAIDAFQRGNEFVVRADVPGMSRNDLTVEIGDDSLTVRGERKHEQREERDGVYWSERSYGSFTRVVPLPPGAIADSAKANFNNGVLEVVIQAPSQEARRGRRVDITGHDDAKK